MGSSNVCLDVDYKRVREKNNLIQIYDDLQEGVKLKEQNTEFKVGDVLSSADS